MANKQLQTLLDLPVPKGQTPESLKVLLKAINKLDPSNVYTTEFKDVSTGFKFKNFKDLESFLKSSQIGLPKNISPNYYGVVVQHWIDTFTTPVEYEKADQSKTYEYKPEGVTQTTLTPEELEKFEQEAKKTKEQKTVIEQRQKETIQAGIKRQQELQQVFEKSQEQLKQNIAETQKAADVLKDKVIYATVVIPETKPLSQDGNKDLESLRLNAQQDSEVFIKETTKIIEEKITPGFKERLSSEQILSIAESTAADIASKLNPPKEAVGIVPVYTQSAILNTIKADTSILSNIVDSKEALGTFKNISITQLLLENSPEQAHRIIAQTYLGKLTPHIYGPDPSQINVTLHQNRVDNALPINLGYINNDALQLQQRQDIALTHLQQLPIDQAQSVFLSGTRSYIQNKIESLPAQHAAKIIYNSDIGRLLLARYGLADPLTYQATNAFGRMVLQYSPETAPYFSAVGRLSGANVGLGAFSGGALAIAASSYAATGTSIALTGGIMASEAFLGGAGAALGTSGAGAGAALGTAGGPLAWITVPLGAVAGAVFGKAISKIQQSLPKIKLWLQDNAPTLAILSGLGIFFAGGPLRALLVIPTIAFGGMALSAGGLGAIGTGIAGIWSLLIAMGSFVAFEIATPVIITVVSIPILVAFIMLVINSGAYVVPLSNPYAGFEASVEGMYCSDQTGTNYCFPVAPRKGVEFGCFHHDYVASDIFRKGDKPGKSDDKPMTIVAYIGGKVIWTSTNNSLGGEALIIAGDDKRFYYYAHNDKNLVSNGQTVKTGQPIAIMDSTGNASGTQEHLHFGISKKNDFRTLKCNGGTVSSGCVSQAEWNYITSFFVAPTTSGGGGDFKDKLNISCPQK